MEKTCSSEMSANTYQTKRRHSTVDSILLSHRLATVMSHKSVIKSEQASKQASFPPCLADRFWGSPSLLSNGYGGLFLRVVNRLGREAERSSAITSAKVKNT
jgi:hypothetical protein